MKKVSLEIVVKKDGYKSVTKKLKLYDVSYRGEIALFLKLKKK